MKKAMLIILKLKATLLGSLVLAVIACSESGDSGESPKQHFGRVGAVTSVSNPHNVVASELLGAWELDGQLTKRLRPEWPRVQTRFSFSENEVARDRIITAMTKLLDELKGSDDELERARIQRAFQAVYLAGRVKMIQDPSIEVIADFALVAMDGNPKLVIYDPKRKVFEFGNVMLARNEDGDADLLFLGGDLNNQSFKAFVRSKANDNPD